MLELSKPNMEFVATTFQGLEDILEQEIRDLGGLEVTKVKRAVTYKGDLALLYRSNYQLRTALRILYKLDQFKVHSYSDLYDVIHKMPWSDHLDLSQTFSINAVTSSPFFKHSQYVTQKAKDAIVDQFRNKYGRRPDVDVKNQDILIHLYINGRNLSVYLDSSGAPLFKRNYRTSTVEAPLNEVLVAGILSLMDLQKGNKLWDPMCGSGTFLTEAYLMSENIPPQICRNKFAFLNWRDADKKLWLEIKNQAKDQNTESLNLEIKGSDIDPDAVSITKENVSNIPNALSTISLNKADFFSSEIDGENLKIVMNPPYDKRLELDDAIAFYKRIGDQLKTHCKGCEAYIFSGHLQALKLLGLKPDKKISLFNGPIESKLHKYSIY